MSEAPVQSQDMSKVLFAICMLCIGILASLCLHFAVESQQIRQLAAANRATRNLIASIDGVVCVHDTSGLEVDNLYAAHSGKHLYVFTLNPPEYSYCMFFVFEHKPGTVASDYVAPHVSLDRATISVTLVSLSDGRTIDQFTGIADDSVPYTRDGIHLIKAEPGGFFFLSKSIHTSISGGDYALVLQIDDISSESLLVRPRFEDRK